MLSLSKDIPNANFVHLMKRPVPRLRLKNCDVKRTNSPVISIIIEDIRDLIFLEIFISNKVPLGNNPLPITKLDIIVRKESFTTSLSLKNLI